MECHDKKQGEKLDKKEYQSDIKMSLIASNF